MRTLIIVSLLACPQPAFADDKWFAPDKAKHFGAGAAAGARTLVALVIDKTTD